MSEIVKTLLKDQLDCYRLQRHDFLNHWQVVMGYLQLKQGDKAFEYARSALKGIEIEQRVSQIAHSEVLVVLLGWIIQLRKEDISLELDFPERMKEEAFWLELWKEEYTEAFYGYTKECLKAVLEKANPNGSDDSSLKAKIILGYNSGCLNFSFELSQKEELLLSQNLELK